MKKIVCISLCVFLCVPLLALSVFADLSVECVASSASLDLINVAVNGRGGEPSNPYSFSLPVGVVVTLRFTRYNSETGSNLGSFEPSYNGVVLSRDSSNPTVIPYSSSFSLDCSPSAAIYSYYVYLSEPSALDNLDVSAGVSSFIGFGGDVLHFITSNSAILTLLGLSVGLCLVIPFGISKIKELVKGY